MPDRPPLFIALRREFFEAFATGAKTEEWRAHRGRWTTRHVFVGRLVVLSLGYAGQSPAHAGRRLRARIARVDLRYPETPEQVAFFGAGTECIVLSLVDITPDR